METADQWAKLCKGMLFASCVKELNQEKALDFVYKRFERLCLPSIQIDNLSVLKLVKQADWVINPWLSHHKIKKKKNV